jgi:hypothetical protein
MASVIRIKRSGTAGNPSTLAAGELAYSAADAEVVQGGDRLYVGFGTETNGNAANHFVVGGKFFTDMLDHAKGTLTADSALVVDANKKIDEFFVDNLKLDGNTISSTNASGNINIVPNGTGQTIISGLVVDDGVTQRTIDEYIEDIAGGQIQGTSGVISVTYNDTAGETTIDLVETGVTAGSYGSSTAIPTFTVDSDGRLTAAGTVSVATTLSVSGDSGTASVDLLSDTINFVGSNNISTNVDSATDIVTISVTDATTSQKGIASFETANFTVSSGAVSAKDITLGTSTLTLGSTTSSITGLESLAVDNIQIDGNVITATNTDGDVSINPNGTGVVSVNDSLITDVNDPANPKDAANKRYVDEVAQGLSAKPADDVATTANLVANYDNGSSGVGATLTSTTNGAFPLVDGYQLTLGETILVKDQTNAFENGSYELTQVGDASNPWILTRTPFVDETDEIASAFEFVVNGTQFGNSGFVATVPSDFLIGSSDPTTDTNGFTARGDIEWVQFSGAGTFTAGDALSLNGTEFNLNLAVNSGLLISADKLQVDSTIAGNGLTLTSGVINVGGTDDRIAVSGSAIDIASTYVGQSSITTLGTIGTGTWQGTIIDPTYGGTGVNNGSNTFTLGGNVEFSGAFSSVLTVTGTTAVTLPTSGTLATLAGTETFTNKTINNSSIGSTNPGTGAFTTLDASGLVSFTNTTDSTSTVSGALVVSGGVGIGKKVYVGDDIIGAGPDTSRIDGFEIDGGTY